MRASQRRRTVLVMSLCGALALTNACVLPSVAQATNETQVAANQRVVTPAGQQSASGTATTTVPSAYDGPAVMAQAYPITAQVTGDEPVVGGVQPTSEESATTTKQLAPITAQADPTQVSTYDELVAALADPQVTTIALVNDITTVGPLEIDVARSLMIDLGDNHLAFSGDSEKGLIMRSGTVELRNGSVYSHANATDAFVIEQQGGELTLGNGTYVHAFSGQALSVKSGAKATIAGANVSTVSTVLPAIVVEGKGSLLVESGEFNPGDYGNQGQNFSVGPDASVVVKGGTFSDEEDSFKKCVPEGYAIEESAGSSETRYTVKGDLAGKLANVTVDPKTYAYDGTAKEPKVTVTLDGKDVTSLVRVSYENNRNVGTATVRVTPRYTSDPLVGTATATFEITASSYNDLANARVAVLPDTYVYDGTAKEPTVTVWMSDRVVSSELYTVSYSNNLHAGTATVTIAAKQGVTAADEESPVALVASDEEAAGETNTGGTNVGNENDNGKSVDDTNNADANTNGEEESGNASTESTSTDTTEASTPPMATARTTTTTTTTAPTTSASSTTTRTTTAPTSVTGSTTATFTISRKQAYVIANSVTKKEGDPDPAFSATVLGTIGSDTLAYTFTREQGESAGTYKITPVGDAEQGDYKVSYQSGVLGILATATTSATRTTSPAATTSATPATSGTTTTTTKMAATPATADASLPWGLPAFVGAVTTTAVGMRYRSRRRDK